MSLVVVLIVVTPVVALSQEQDLKEAILHCAAVDDSSNRLDCYDSLAEALASPGQSRSPDQWTVKVVKDPIDDTTTVILRLMGTQHQTELLLRCKQKKPDVLLSLRGQVVGAIEPVVWTRLGVAKAEKKRWSVSADHMAVILPGDPKLFIRLLLSVDRLVIQMDHFLRGPITDVFNVHRLKDVIAPLSDACRLE